MRHLICSLSIVLILISNCADAQTDLKISKKQFRNDKSGFDEAWKHVTGGDSFYKDGGAWYASAYEEYLKASLYNGVNPELNYKAGVAALFSDNKEKAIDFFSRVMEEKSDIAPDVLFFTGRALQYAGRYDEAVEKLGNFIATADKKQVQLVELAKKYIEECKAAAEIIKDTLRVKIENVGSGINSNADDYSELPAPDGKTMYFASRRQLSKSSTEYDDSRFDENIFFSTNINGEWGMAVSAGKNLTTKYCETPLYIDPSGEKLYIYAGYEGGGDIRVSERKKESWKDPQPVSFNINSGGTETSMTISPSGNEVWFVSDHGKEGLGGRDIYFIKKIDDRKWSKPLNAGAAINTRWDEESLRFSDNGDTLFFASMGHTTMGGFDIFYSVKDQDGAWSGARNIGFPVNSQWDELFFHPGGKAGNTFYFASNRPESIGGLDIFRGTNIPPEPVIVPVIIEPPRADTVIIRDTVVVVKEVVQAPPPPPPAPVAEPPKEPVLYLTGRVKDSETGDPILAKIDLIDLSTDGVIATTASSDVDGSYKIELPGKKSYMVDVRGTGFLSDMKRIDIPAAYTGESYSLDMSLVKVKVGKKVVLNNILFETGKAILTTGSYAELDRLYNILEDNPLMKIEISGHTDNTGSATLNNTLSANRAKSVVDYLIHKGIVASRLEYKGFGSLQPIADNATPEGRKMNRRVEFKILEF